MSIILDIEMSSCFTGWVFGGHISFSERAEQIN
jgi:hypothetical protein